MTSERQTVDLVLVDDDRSVHVFVERQLRGEDRTLTTFDDAEEALAWLGSHRPRVLIVDYRLPTTDGRRLIAALGGAAAAADHTVLCTSGGHFDTADVDATDESLELIDKLVLFDRQRFRGWLATRGTAP